MRAEVILATATHLVLSFGLILLTARLDRHTHEVAATHWLVQRLLLPLGRALTVSVFLLIAYPALFGLEHAAPIGVLLEAPTQRFPSLINGVFVLSLLLPLIPLFGREGLGCPCKASSPRPCCLVGWQRMWGRRAPNCGRGGAWWCGSCALPPSPTARPLWCQDIWGLG